MTTSAANHSLPLAIGVTVTDDLLNVELSDGRALSVPLSWFPRLLQATADERARWRLIGGGEGIHWEAIDEDISVEGLLAGRASNESEYSLKRWRKARR